MTRRFTILEHPSDVGILAIGDSREHALESAAEGLVTVMADPTRIRDIQSKPLRIHSEDEDVLPILWLNEIVFYFDAEHFLFRSFHISSWSEHEIRGQGWGQTFEPRIHQVRTAVKAVTYHQFKSQEVAVGWKIQVFLDI